MPFCTSPTTPVSPQYSVHLPSAVASLPPGISISSGCGSDRHAATGRVCAVRLTCVASSSASAVRTPSQPRQNCGVDAICFRARAPVFCCFFAARTTPLRHGPGQPSIHLARDQDTPLSIKTASSLGRAGLGPRTDASHSRQISLPDAHRHSGGSTSTCEGCNTRPSTDARPTKSSLVILFKLRRKESRDPPSGSAASGAQRSRGSCWTAPASKRLML